MNEHIAACRAVLRAQDLLPPADSELAIFVVGSVARGWAHENSDIDVVVVCRDRFEDDPRVVFSDIPLDPGSIPGVTFKNDGISWQVKYWQDSQVDQLLAKVSWPAFDSDRKSGERVNSVEELFLGRWPTSVAVSGDEWLRRRQQELHDSAFRSFIIMHALTSADDQLETALGQLAVGEVECAVLTARAALGWTVIAILADQREYSNGLKWRPRQMRLVDSELMPWPEYWALETMQDFSPDNPDKWIGQIVEVCKNASLHIEVTFP